MLLRLFLEAQTDDDESPNDGVIGFIIASPRFVTSALSCVRERTYREDSGVDEGAILSRLVGTLRNEIMQYVPLHCMMPRNRIVQLHVVWHAMRIVSSPAVRSGWEERQRTTTRRDATYARGPVAERHKQPRCPSW